MLNIIRQARAEALARRGERSAARRGARGAEATRILTGGLAGGTFVVDLSRPLIEDGREQAEGFIEFLEEQERSDCPCPICMELLADARRSIATSTNDDDS